MYWFVGPNTKTNISKGGRFEEILKQSRTLLVRWVLKKREEQRLEAAQMKFLRHLLGITKLDKEKNQCIRQKTTASNVPIVAIDVTTSLSLTGNRDWVLCIEYEVFI